MNQPSPTYRHTQIGHVVVIALTSGMLLCAGLLLIEFSIVSLIVLAVLAACLWLFATLTVTVDDGLLAVRFRSGLVRKWWPLGEITDAQVVRNPGTMAGASTSRPMAGCTMSQAWERCRLRSRMAAAIASAAMNPRYWCGRYGKTRHPS